MIPRHAIAPALFALAAATTACDPCSGIASCAVEPRVAFEGQIVTTVEGTPVAGARVELSRPAGDEEGGATASATTGADGTFFVSLPVRAAGSTTVDVLVTPPDQPAYRIDDMPVQALNRRGDIHVADVWVDRPYFPCAGEAWPVETPTGAVRLSGERMEFHQTSGTPVSGTGSGPITMTTDAYGRFPLLGRRVYTTDLAPIMGDVALVRGSERLWARDVVLEPTHLFRPYPAVCVLIFGNHFRYLAQAVVNGVPVDGVPVTFRRVGGVAGTPASFTTQSAGFGLFSLERFTPADTGVVIFELTFTPPAPLAPLTVTDTLPVLETWSPGEQYTAYHLDRPDDPRGPVITPQ